MIPAYQRIARDLRRAIAAGELAPGAQIPPEPQLIQKYGVARETVRRGIAELVTEGLLSVQPGRGTFVRERPPLLQVATRHQHPERAAFLVDLDARGLEPEVRVTVRREAASEHVAVQLGVDPGQEVLVRERVMGARGEPPVQYATSYIPLSVAERAPRLQEVDTGEGGMHARLIEAGYRLHITEHVAARMPSPEERRVLRLEAGTPVLAVVRVVRDDDQDVTVEFLERVLAGDRYQLAYDLGTKG